MRRLMHILNILITNYAIINIYIIYNLFPNMVFYMQAGPLEPMLKVCCTCLRMLSRIRKNSRHSPVSGSCCSLNSNDFSSSSPVFSPSIIILLMVSTEKSEFCCEYGRSGLLRTILVTLSIFAPCLLTNKS
jgi:hypothetical protein